ncbi:hypothetical protein G7Y89_g10728 [Cudoniella acicularis]|uniref:Mid2 domain-containing protein n=1 Tax=Cudoniella acicularis TaxID=354080 RepID=A0A8H4REH8_9HELO|nr:hypothetical protein G7Y89_g10728 [Cudoniella acicularis]
MRTTRGCWICMAALAAGCIGRSWAMAGENEEDTQGWEESSLDGSPELEMDGQKVIVMVVTSESVFSNTHASQEIKDTTDLENPIPKDVFTVVVTSKTTSTISHPKITEAPLLYRRKLGSTHWDNIHEQIQGQKRDATECSAGYQLCPQSLSGGCCPTDRADVVQQDICYATSVTTFTLTETVYTTTDASSNVHTITSAIVTASTPSAPTATVSSIDLVPKLASSAVPIAKTSATGTPSTNSGLTTSMIGGIIGGSVVFLATILVVAFCILRRLHKVEKVATANSRSSSSGRSRRRPAPMEQVDVDAMSVDPLMITGSEISSTAPRPSYQSGPYSSAHEVEANSPPMFTSPFTPRSPPHTHYPRGYNPVATSDLNYSQPNSAGIRNPSIDSTPPNSQNPDRGYFDLPIQSNRISQSSIPTRRLSQHGRNWSNASDQSGVSNVSSEHAPAELDSQPEEGRRSSLQRALYGLGMGRMVSRRRSDPIALSGGPAKRADWNSPASPGLGHIPEAGESQHHVPQYHSPADVGGFGITKVQESPQQGGFGITQVREPPQQRQRGLSASQLRDAGLSNAQLREMTMFEANPYHSPPPGPENSEKL